MDFLRHPINLLKKRPHVVIAALSATLIIGAFSAHADVKISDAANMSDPIPEGMLEVQGGSDSTSPIMRIKNDADETIVEVEPDKTVGIATEEPTHTLDVNGGARVRSLPAGTNEYEIVVADNDGVLHTVSNYVGTSGRWTSTDTTTNVNVINVHLPLFATEDFNTGPFTVNSPTEIQVDENGVYRIGFTVTLRNILGIRNNAIARLWINGQTPPDLYAATGYMRNNSGHQVSSLHMTTLRKLSAEDKLTIRMFQEANSGTVVIASAGGAEFWIEKAQ